MKTTCSTHNAAEKNFIRSSIFFIKVYFLKEKSAVAKWAGTGDLAMSQLALMVDFAAAFEKPYTQPDLKAECQQELKLKFLLFSFFGHTQSISKEQLLGHTGCSLPALPCKAQKDEVPFMAQYTTRRV